ncbi:MAG: NAD(P)H-quinone oxidoreductase [Bacteroidota bacterium]
MEHIQAVRFEQSGGPEVLYLGEIPALEAGPNEILVSVSASALNRADTLQRKGKYPPPPGASQILGLEMSGTVIGIGTAVKKWAIGDQVCGLLPGGGYAAQVVIHEDLAMSVPSNVHLVEAAAIPEVFLTAWQAIHLLADLQAGEKILIHAGGSGVGTAAIQIARELGAEIFVTASAGKHARCYALGAHHCIDYRTDDFREIVMNQTAGQGVDIIIDFLAAPYFQQNIDSLALDGRMIMLALMGGIAAQHINLVNILRKRLRIQGSTLRNRSLAYKIALTQSFSNFAQDRWESKALKPVIDSVFSWEAVAEAHSYMEANQNIGKIVLQIGG